MARKNDIEKLLQIQTMRLQKLKEQQAMYGTLQTPPYITLEIEDLEKKIKRLQEELSDFHTIPSPSVSITFTPLPLNRGFIGREDTLDLLTNQLKDFPVVLVEGLSGIGKTFLLARYISQQKSSLKNKVFWLECQEGTTINDIFGAFFDFARRNNDPEMESVVQEERPINDRLHSLISILESRFAILCLDGFENADDENIAPLVREFIEHCQNARLIICTRERPKNFFDFLADIGEVILGGLGIADAVKMLDHLQVHDEKGVSREQIVQKTDGHPFALKLCASLVRYGLTLVDLLNDSPEFGKSLEEHWLSKIYARLSEEERILLERFSVYVEPVPRDGIQQISASSDWIQNLHSLQDKFLISQVSSGYFSMHSLIHKFCRQKLRERNLFQETAQLAANYYLGNYSLYGYNRDLSQNEVSDKLKAHHYLISADNFGLAAKVVHNIQHMLMIWARYSQLLPLLETSLTTDPMSDKAPWFQYYKGRILYIQGKLEASRCIFEQLSKSTEQDVAAESIQMLANLYLTQNKTDDIIQLFENNLAVFRHRAKSQQRMFDKIARVYIEKGDSDRAISIYNQILHWQQAEEERLGAAVTLRQLASIYLTKDDFTNAHNLLNLAQMLAMDVGEQRLVAWIERTRGEVYEKAGVLPQALEYYEKSLEIQITIDNRVEIVPLANKLIHLHEKQGNKERLLYLSKLISQTQLEMSEN